MFGFTGTDPRWQQMGYAQNTPTMQMRSLYHQLENFTQQMDEAQRRDVLDRQSADLEAQMRYGGGPVLQGQAVAPWLQPHIEWAREFVRNNEGRMPTQQDLSAALSRYGRRIEDYAYPGNPGGTVGPGAQLAGGGGPGGGGALDYGTAMSPEQRALLERARQFDVQAGLQALETESRLRADPFALERYRRGLSAQGVPTSINAVAGQGLVARAQGAQGPQPNAPSLQAQQAELQGVPAFGMASANQQLAALPQLNQINARNYMRLDPSGRNYVNSAFRAAGMAGEDADVEEAVRRGLPQFAQRGTPTFGRVA